MASADPRGVTRRFHAHSWTPVVGFPFTVDADWWPHRRGSYPPEPGGNRRSGRSFGGGSRGCRGRTLVGRLGSSNDHPGHALAKDRGVLATADRRSQRTAIDNQRPLRGANYPGGQGTNWQPKRGSVNGLGHVRGRQLGVSSAPSADGFTPGVGGVIGNPREDDLLVPSAVVDASRRGFLSRSTQIGGRIGEGITPRSPAVRPECWGRFQTLSGTHMGGLAGVFKPSLRSSLTADRGNIGDI